MGHVTRAGTVSVTRVTIGRVNVKLNALKAGGGQDATKSAVINVSRASEKLVTVCRAN